MLRIVQQTFWHHDCH